MAHATTRLSSYRIVFHWFRNRQTDGTWQRRQDKLRERVRKQAGKTSKPSVGIFDRQTVKTTEQDGPRGYDAGKKALGRKRHVVVDSLGLVWSLCVTPADIQDRDGGKLALLAFREVVKFPKVIWADTAYTALIDWTWVL